ncbi:MULTISPECIES: hypothetical protein [unclassified Legionella]|uniref:hypothetical protein n=1 Tax=unclassified Legionella TaxID=2622702 RepID=UPI0010558200|nr:MULTISPECIES: hypothetical protein [unclassified Legionella]MDI9818728.1 hypothetical protein [Legionella sp. PL877]
MNKFCPKEYYIRQNEEILGKTIGERVELKPQGMLLVESYYADKYQAAISPAYLAECERITSRLSKIRENAKNYSNYRDALIVDQGFGYHSFPYIYLKEDNQEIVLIVDSQGGKALHRKVAEAMFKQTGITTYAVEDSYQSDNYSCHTGALAIAKDCVAKETSGKYRLKNLLPTIKERAKVALDSPGFYWAKLPNELLKVPHLSQFVEEHEQASERPINKKGASLRMFRDRFKLNCGGITINDYLRQKGLHFANIIEIQFYAEQLKEKLKGKLKEKWLEEFISDAKTILRNNTSPDSHELLFKYVSEWAQKNGLPQEIDIESEQMKAQATSKNLTLAPDPINWPDYSNVSLPEDTLLTKQRYNAIHQVASQLQSEVDSSWPYPNKSRKKEKVKALASFAELLAGAPCSGKTLVQCIDEIKQTYPDLTKGARSRVGNLLEGFIEEANLNIGCSFR